jgi:dynein heavy chain
MPEPDNAAMLFNRLNKYGPGSKPGALVAPQRRQGVASPGGLAPLPPPPALQSPALRQSQKRGPDAALSSGSLHDATMLSASNSKGTLLAGTELLSASAPMPFSKMSRSLPKPPPPPPPLAAAAPAAAASNGTVAAAANGAGASAGATVKRDPFWFIQMLRTSLAEHEFAYMNIANAHGAIWDPYDLKIVPFHEVDQTDHYTISEAGVTHCIRKGKQEVTEFTPLEQWEVEATRFKEVMAIPFFKQYQSWKAYSSWRGVIKKDKMIAAGTVLSNHLFILNSTFQPSLLQVRKLCVELSQMKLHKIKKGSTYTLDAFVNAQEEHKILTCEKLGQFFEAVREAVQQACDTALDRFEREESAQASAAAGAGDQTTPRPGKGEAVVKRSFLQQAQLRSVCKKITNYIRVVDYIVLSTLHQLLMSSLSDLLYMFESVKPGYHEPPVLTEEQKAELEKMLAKGKKPPVKDKPLFQVDIYFQAPDAIEYSPSAHEFSHRIDATIMDFVNMLMTVGTLISHGSFKRYTQPVINGRQDTVEISEGFDIKGLIDDNDEYNNVCDAIRTSFDTHFAQVQVYTTMLEPHTTIYLQNESTDMATYAEATLEEWQQLMDKFIEQELMMRNIPLAAEVGIFAANNSRVKDLFMPSPRRCLDDIFRTLPRLAKEHTQKLLAELSNANETLTKTPDNVEDFVAFSKFLITTNARQPEFSERGKLVQDMYELMGKYKVPVPDSDTAATRMMDSGLLQVSNIVAECEAGQEEKTNNFVGSIDTSIEKLRNQASELRTECEDKRVYDGHTPMDEALAILDGWWASFTELKESSARFESYQEVLKVPVTKYDDVETLEVNLKLKRNMWQGLNDFGEQVEAWKKAPFETLNTELMQVTVAKYGKVVAQCDKGLPTNTVLPKLADAVTVFKALTPVVVALRNTALQPRHWENIEMAIHTPIDRTEGVFSLGYLLDLKVNEFKDEIEGISVAATQEAVLEEMLAKVENAWKTLEFGLNMYKEQKDVFILGGVDDVMAVLEETQVAVQTILGSRFVGPMQKKVDEWEKKLRLFSETLDEWLAVQRSWMYLESIFKAADIQRQLPNEYKDFDKVNKMWLELMRKTNADPSALKQATAPKLKENLEKANATLDRVQKNLEEYLETKRNAFPRFFFLSNDELLEILAEARNPQAVQPHLIKCFDNIKKLDFGSEPNSIDIFAMYSGEGEKVGLGKNLKARGNVESWLGAVEDAMFRSIRELIKVAVGEFEEEERIPWIKGHAAQIVITVAAIFWAKEVELRLSQGDKSTRPASLKEYNGIQVQELNECALQVGGELPKLHRKVFCALITGDVHNRDIVTDMVKEKVDSPHSFTWQMQLRFYWDVEIDDCVVRQVNAKILYGCEYQGCLSRLVITPLTDRCWLTITGGLHVKLGSAPAGPAGTGKTESTKDLAKGIAVQCVVFNCSDQLDYKMMGKLFSGVAQTGCWTCLDEFNRIDIEVLSVVAQQLLAVRQALLAEVSRFLFEGHTIGLKPTCGVFITMNPGYAGRTELPDNLKALFRPVSMMVPDYALIGEIMLYAEGFLDSRVLAQKMVKMYKLCSEQLSQQDHYDYGMRQVKSVLVMAGEQKRANPELHENISLIRAMLEANIPRFLADDLPLFAGIIGDLYPNLEIPAVDYGALKLACEDALVRAGLQVVPRFVVKTIELYQTMNVRFGVMTVGPTGGGKSCCLRALQSAQGNLKEQKHQDSAMAQECRTYIFNPKCITMGELYGEFNPLTQEWTDGLGSTFIRGAVTLTGQSDDYQWVVFDGPVDAIWIENMNTVLDDNMTLCLANGERIKLNKKMHMVFEVEDLSVASPATVSRVGIVYLTPENLGWRPYVTSWTERELFPAKNLKNEYGELMNARLSVALSEHVFGLFSSTIDVCLKWHRDAKRELVPTVDSQLIESLCAMFIALIPLAKLDLADAKHDDNKKVCSSIYFFSLIWSIGASIDELHWQSFDDMLRELLGSLSVQFPGGGDVHDYYVDLPAKDFKPWKDITPDFTYDPKASFFSMLVPTVDTVRYSFVFTKSLLVDRPVLFTGQSGVGKSVVIAAAMTAMVDGGSWTRIDISYSAQTKARQTQEAIESKLDKLKKTLLGPPPGKRLVMFIDDVNMPALEEYGASPPVELIRQFLDFKGFYDRQKLFFKDIVRVTSCCACGPPGGGKMPLTPRYVRHHTVVAVTQPSSDAMKRIFSKIVEGALAINGNADIMALAKPIVESSVEIYFSVLNELKPIPAKAHYTFNLRDVSKIVQGVLMMRPNQIPNKETLAMLWAHEALRVFSDRLIDDDDRKYFGGMVVDSLKVQFKMSKSYEDIFCSEQKLVFGDYTKMGVPRDDRRYEMVADTNKLSTLFVDYLDQYNSENKEMKLVFFWDAIDHVSRLARVLRQPRGNAMLVGVGGSGKQSLTRFAAYMSEMKCFQIELTKGYGTVEFREDLKKCFFTAGCDKNEEGVVGSPIVFLFADTQVVEESFVEDINNILNSGEVPNLFANDEWEKITNGMRPLAKDREIPETKDNLKKLFVDRTRENLHIVLAMSPVGSAFRVRCRMFPSLINCCTIDWYDRWPVEALQSVAKQFLEPLEFGDDPEVRMTILTGLIDMSSIIHTTVIDMSQKFFAQLKRRFYVTPKSFLELIALYLGKLDVKRGIMDVGIKRLEVGIKKLTETNAMVDGMQKTLTALQPELERKSKETEVMIIQVNKDRVEADKTKAQVAKDEAAVKEVADKVQVIADDAKRDLEAAMPAMNNAIKALDSLSKNDIVEIKNFKSPPPLVQKVLEAVCILLGSAPDWDTAKKVMSDTGFLQRLKDYDKDNIPPATIKKILKYYNDEEFEPDKVQKVSSAAKSLCMWVRAMKVYDEVAKVVEPKKLVLAESMATLQAEQVKLKKVQDALAEVIAKVENLQATCDRCVAESKPLQDTADTTAKRLIRAGKLTSGLAEESVRWAETVETLRTGYNNLTGDVFIAAAFIAYCGPFTTGFRKECMAQWVTQCNERGIPASPVFSLPEVMGDPVETAEWQIFGLPVDEYSTENGILATRGKRWPLAIDPQAQANKWMRNMEAANAVKVCKGNDPTILRTLENAIRMGSPVILEDVGEELDPALEPVLQKQIYKQGGRSLIRLGDSDIDYNENFKFYLTTKLPNPHYLPEVCIKVTIINFTVTQEGLEDQLLGLVVREERPDLERAKNQLIKTLAADKRQLKDLQDKILRLLSESEGNILDDEVLINALSDSKITSSVIQGRVAEAETTNKEIDATRLTYTPAATRGSIIYFTIADLGMIGDMYQFSLEYFAALFLVCIQKSEKASELEQRLANVMKYASFAIYTNVSRALFSEHKILFSFMLGSAIQRNAGLISPSEWQLLLVGAGIVDESKLPACPDGIEMSQWVLACVISERVEPLSAFASCIANDVSAWKPLMEADAPWQVFPLPEPLGTSITPFQRLLVIKVFRPEKIVECIAEYIADYLGREYIDQPPLDLHVVFPDTLPSIPLVFVLSAGADPMATILRFATEKGRLEKTHAISLGQGQGPIAAALIEKSTKNGDWVILQNCHLAKSWMPKLEKIVEAFPAQSSMNDTFRLWLTSMPAKYFPVPVLQCSAKMTFEPPKGMRANLKGTWLGLMTQDIFDCCHEKRAEWKKLLFGLTFFHAVIQERRKFGPLGWNIRYDFNNTDLEVSIQTLQMFLDEQPVIPWDALLYICGQIHYGGRVTDICDKGTLVCILQAFFTPDALKDGYEFANDSAIYHAPVDTDLQGYRDYVDTLPFTDSVGIFGLHANAKITFEKQESDGLLSTVTDIQPALGGGSGGASAEEVVDALAKQLEHALPKVLDRADAGEGVFALNEKGELNSLQIVLLAEMSRFNRLLKRCSTSLRDLQNSIKGLVVMSSELDAMFGAMLKNQVPKMWTKVAYPSLKPLSGWFKDLGERVTFFTSWLKEGQPNCFNLPAFFFQQGFMTGMLQLHARRYQLPIDTLSYTYKIMKYEKATEVPEPPKDGVYIEGFFIVGARFDRATSMIADSFHKEMFDTMPVFHFIPAQNFERNKKDFACPLYKTAERKGVLTTTGASSNYILDLDIPTSKTPDYWMRMGVAALCALAD